MVKASLKVWTLGQYKKINKIKSWGAKKKY
jgi:hypothetical protein